MLKFYDYPEANNLFFQDPATPVMEGIIDFHHDLMGMMLWVLIFVLWMIISIMYHYSTTPKTKRPRFWLRPISDFVFRGIFYRAYLWKIDHAGDIELEICSHNVRLEYLNSILSFEFLWIKPLNWYRFADFWIGDIVRNFFHEFIMEPEQLEGYVVDWYNMVLMPFKLRLKTRSLNGFFAFLVRRVYSIRIWLLAAPLKFIRLFLIWNPDARYNLVQLDRLRMYTKAVAALNLLKFRFIAWLLLKPRHFLMIFSPEDLKEPVALPRALPIFHNTQLEIIWTIVPTLMLWSIITPSFALLYAMDELVAPLITVKAIGRQWYWQYEYSDHNIHYTYESRMLGEASEDWRVGPGLMRLLDVDNTLVLPQKIHVRLLVTASDVLHSFAVPSFGVKLDGCPGRLNQTGIYVKRVGVYYGQCSELCGVNHAFMPIVVNVVSLDQYLDWYLSKKPTLLSAALVQENATVENHSVPESNNEVVTSDITKKEENAEKQQYWHI